jgi:uncharacterized protein YchJ
MGRDDHFLSRLSRFEHPHAALAIELFRYPCITQRAIEHTARGPLDRVALSLDGALLGPRVISMADGQFVTCLAGGWVNGPWAVVDRAQIDRARGELWLRLLRSIDVACDARWADVVPAIEHAGGHLTSADSESLEALCASEPHVREALLARYRAAWMQGVAWLARRPEGAAVSVCFALDLWSIAWALVHLRAAGEGTRASHQGRFTAAEREARRAAEVDDAVSCARRAAVALRLASQQRLPHNQQCECGSGKRARRCCQRGALVARAS